MHRDAACVREAGFRVQGTAGSISVEFSALQPSTAAAERRTDGSRHDLHDMAPSRHYTASWSFSPYKERQTAQHLMARLSVPRAFMAANKVRLLSVLLHSTAHALAACRHHCTAQCIRTASQPASQTASRRFLPARLAAPSPARLAAPLPARPPAFCPDAPYTSSPLPAFCR